MVEKFEKYGLGVVVPVLMTTLACLCIYWGVAYVPRLPLLPGRSCITGQTALFINLAYAAMAAFLFSHFYLERSAETLEGEVLAHVLQVGALVVFIAVFFPAASGVLLPGL